MIDQDAIRARYNALGPFLNERDRRLFAACEARAAGRGGIVAVSRTTGIARSTIGRGLADLRSGAERCSERVRRRGGGQKPASGRELRPKGQPEPVRVHDFAIPGLGKAVPYGIYDVSANAGFVNVGSSADTGEFSVASIRRWWYAVGAPRYPDAKQMLINADCGGSNGARLRLWKRELQVLADELGIEITVCHVPSGTSKWNKIEHRLFSFITQNWRGKPLISYLVIVQLIASTTTDTGLTVACRLDDSDYAKGIKVTDAEMAALNIQPADFHGEWNYTIAPRWPDG